MPLRIVLLIVFALITSTAGAQNKTREQKVREDKQRVESEGFWIYNDLPKAFAEARRTGKPILVVLRCIPCEECVKLDDELVDQDPVIRPLLQKFVCARQVSTNGLDLSIFQYDTDQSFAVFMLNADGTVYGRFGTRSHRTDWLFDVSLAGMARALEGALELHADYPANRASLAGKTGPKPEFASPEKYPALKDKYTDSLNYKGDVVKSCIHCHQIGDAVREYYWTQNKPIPEHILFPYPHPKSLGLILDPEQRATVKSVNPESTAEQAGFRPGDRIQTLDGQPLLSIADVQWVLHNVSPEGGTIKAQVVRNGSPATVTLSLEKGWRQNDDISWRVTSWGLRRMTTGGMKLEPFNDVVKRPADLPATGMALRVMSVGRYGPHATAMRTGFKQGDIITAVNGVTDLDRETDFFRYVINHAKPGERINITFLRDGKTMSLQLPVQR